MLLFMRKDTVRLLRPALSPRSAVCRTLPHAGAQAPGHVESGCKEKGVNKRLEKMRYLNRIFVFPQSQK